MIHVQIWDGSRSARLTDMTNAGKRGKTCRIYRFSGACWGYGSNLNDLQRRAYDVTNHILHYLKAVVATESYDTVRDQVSFMVDEARHDGIPEGYVAGYDEEIKAIKAPRQVPTAGVAGVWGGHADEDGISLEDLKDPNMWREITHHDQSRVRAYEIAAKVWPQVQQAKTLHDAADILRAAGARLHGYCGMD
jgi:hypothetical protein